MPRSLHPHYRAVTRRRARQPGSDVRELPYVREPGHMARDAESYEGQDITALVIQQPNFFGVLEEVDALTDWAHAHGALVIAVVNPTSLALLKPPGRVGR